MKHRYLKNVVTLELSAEKCTGCGRCVQVCPHQVLALCDGSVQIIDRDSCMECGACQMNCPAGALSVQANVGCASAIIKSWITGGEPTCDCSDGACC